MKAFAYSRPTSTAAALAAMAEGARPIAGGTNLVDLMREGVEHPEALVDLGALGNDAIEEHDNGFTVGAGVTNTDLATHAGIRRALPMVSQAIVAGATGQIRNMATVGGNLMQRSRCSYFYDHAAACNKREPGAGCAARDGFARGHAILGASDACVSTHPSDLCLSLVALDAQVSLESLRGKRTVPLEDFYLEPGSTPHLENVRRDDELITAVEVPKLSEGWVTTYRKVRDRSSYAFALVSVAAAVRLEKGTVVDLRLALGGVGTRPWRARAAEQHIRGRAAHDDIFAEGARAELAPATTLPDNEFKLGLVERTITATLRSLTLDLAADVSDGDAR